jgi:hypothetical protein
MPTEREYLEDVHMTPLKQGEILAKLVIDLVAQKVLPADYVDKNEIDLSILDTPFKPHAPLTGQEKPPRYLCTVDYKNVEQGTKLELTGDGKTYSDNRSVFLPKAEVEARVGKNFVVIKEKKPTSLTASSFLGQV